MPYYPLPAWITLEDVQIRLPLVSAEQARAFLEGTLALAAADAPCLLADDFAGWPVAKEILLDAVTRYGTRVTQAGTRTQSAGRYSVTETNSASPTDATERFTPAETARLVALCSGASKGRAKMSWLL